MHKPVFLHESLHLVRTVRLGWLRELVWPVGALLSLLALLAGAQWLDDHEAQRATELKHAYEQGRARGHAEMISTAEAGWQAAHTEAQRARNARSGIGAKGVRP